MGAVLGGRDQRLWYGGAGHVLAEQGCVLGDRGPLGDMGESMGLLPKGVRTDTVEGRKLMDTGSGVWIWVPAQPRRSHLTMGKSFCFSESQFPHLKSR